MRVFVTGATGFVGTAVVQELLKAGHQVLGLTRSEAGAKALTLAGAKVHRGNLEDFESLKSGALASDAVIHTAFIHDFSKFKENCEIDRKAIGAMGAAIAGSDRPLVITSGTGILSGSALANENLAPVPGPNPRIASEEAATALAARGVRIAVMRLPPSVHGDGDHGFVPALINMAREKGVSAYIGEGLNRWPAVHRLDAARLYRLAKEKASAPGTRIHAVAEEGIEFRKIAEVIGKRLHIPVVSKTTAEAADHFTWFAHFAAIHNPSSSHQTRERFGWNPTLPGLLADVDHERYFTVSNK